MNPAIAISPDRLPERLRTLVVDAARARFALDGPPSITAAWQMGNPYSRVVRLELRRGAWSQRFFAKFPTATDVGRDVVIGRLRKEFEVLRDLERRAPKDGAYGTAIALAIDTDEPFLVTVEAAGTPLRTLYARGVRRVPLGRPQADIERAVERCGHWLAEFHASTAIDTRPFDVAALMDYCQIRLHRLHQLEPALVDANAAERLTTNARRVALALPPGGIRISSRHNDFASHNIIAAADSSIRVLDFTMIDQGENAFDACNFWLDLEHLKCDPTYSSARLAHLQQTFLSAYGLLRPDDPDFRLARLRYSVNKLLELAQPRTVWASFSVYRSACLRALKAWLRSFAAQ